MLLAPTQELVLAHSALLTTHAMNYEDNVRIACEAEVELRVAFNLEQDEVGCV